MALFASNSPLSPTELVTLVAGGLVILILLGSLLWAFRPKRRAKGRQQYDAEQFRRKLALDEQAWSALHNVRIRDAHGQVLRVDHVIRLPGSILLVLAGPPNAGGQVKASTKSDVWRYVTDDGRIANYANPAIQALPLIQAVRSRFPLLRIRLLSVWPDAADCSPDTLVGVCCNRDFIQLVKKMATEDGAPSQAVEAAWDPLTRALAQVTVSGAVKQAKPDPAGSMRAAS